MEDPQQQAPESAGPPKPLKLTAKQKKEYVAALMRLAYEAKVAEEVELKRREQAERMRQQLEAERAAYEAKCQHEESLRLAEETSLDTPLREAREQALQAREAARLELANWKKYIEYVDANPLPDVSKESELNTFLSLWRLDPVDESGQNVKATVERCHSAELVAQLIYTVMGQALETRDRAKQVWLARYVRRLRHVSKQKLDLLTQMVVERVDNADTDRREDDDVVTSRACATPSIDYGVWAHAKVPLGGAGRSMQRVKIAFPQFGMDIELPSALQSVRTAIRVIRSKYNHIFNEYPDDDASSPAAAAAVAASAASGRGTANAAESKEEATGSNGTEQRKPGTLGMEVWEYSPEQDAYLGQDDDGDFGSNPDNVSSSASSASSSSSSASVSTSTSASAGAKGLAGVSTGASLSDKKKESVLARAAATLANAGAGPIVVTYSPCYYASVGGIVSIEQIQLPPPPKRWSKKHGPVMREMSSQTEGLVKVAYSAINAEGATVQNAGPLIVSLRLPSNIIVRDPIPLVAYWDASDRVWTTEGLTVMAFEPTSRKLELRVATLKPFALIQPRSLDFPFAGWSIAPISSGVIRVQMQGSRFCVVIDVIGHYVKLISPRMPSLSGLLDTPMEAGVLLCRLAERGITLIPRPSDLRRCARVGKTLALESFVHEEMASVAVVCELSSLAWNGEQGPSSALFSYRFAERTHMAMLPSGDNTSETDFDVIDRHGGDNAAQGDQAQGGNDDRAPGSRRRRRHRGRRHHRDESSSGFGNADDGLDNGDNDESNEDDDLDGNSNDDNDEDDVDGDSDGDYDAGGRRDERKRGGLGGAGSGGAGGERATSSGGIPALYQFDDIVVASDLKVSERMTEVAAMEEEAAKSVAAGVRSTAEAEAIISLAASVRLERWRGILSTETKMTSVRATPVTLDLAPQPHCGSHISLRRVIVEDSAYQQPKVLELIHDIAVLEDNVKHLTESYEKTNMPDTLIERNENAAALEEHRAQLEHQLSEHHEDLVDQFAQADEGTLLMQQTVKKLLNLIRPLTFC